MLVEISLLLLIVPFLIAVVLLCVSCYILKNQAGEQFELRETPPEPPPAYNDEKGVFLI